MAWYEEFFGEEYFEDYADLIKPERTEREVEGILSYLGPAPGARILDLCCGHGRHSIELARRGYEVCGQDLTQVFLDRARRDAEAAGVDVEWLRGDMREIAHPPPFDAVINMFTAFGYFDDDAEELRVLREVHRVLRPGGKLLIDVINRDWLMGRFRERDWQERQDGSRLLLHRRFDPLTGRNREARILVRPSGEIEQSEVSVRLLNPSELRGMLETAGLEVERGYGGFEGEELTPDTSRIVLVATKP
jgi:SAM-dependent methyltransferase